METTTTNAKNMAQESVSVCSPVDSGQSMDLVHSDTENAGLPAPPTTVSTTKESVCISAQRVASDEENESETDIIILPPPSAKQESVQETEVIQTNFITIPFPEAKTAQIQLISSEIIVPSSVQKVVEDKEVNAEACSTTELNSSEIESDITQEEEEDETLSTPAGVTTRSSSRKTKPEHNCSNDESHIFKVPYPVKTTVVIEEMETEENESTLSADNTLLDNSDGTEPLAESNTTASQEAQDTEDSLLVEQYSEAASMDEPKGSLYVEDEGPRFYKVPQNLTSKPLIPIHLPYLFKDLPIFGRPKNKGELPEFQRNKIKQFVGSGLDDEEFDNLAAYCCADNLRTGNELVMQSSPGQGFFPSELDTLSLKNKELSSSHNLNIVRKLKLRTDRDTKNLYAKRYKYRGVRMIPLNNDDEDNTPVVTIGQPIIPGKELLFVIRWYRPFPYNPKDRFGYRSRHSVFSSNIVMLGRHKLSLLRDRVVCPNDVDMRVDVSECPDELPRSSAKELFPSGFLFINNVFYVDKRPGCADYTAPLRRWAKTRGIGDFPCRDMSEVRLDELVVKLGHPEVYVHQGNCEHLFTISEIRLVSAADPHRLSAYPAHTMLSQHQTIYCTTCAEFGAKWIVVGCPRVPFDPAFFCERCFKLYLYKDGKKIGDFKAYLYRGNEINALKPQG